MIRSGLTLVVAVLATIVIGIPAILIGLMDPSGNFGGWCAKLWARIILLTAGVKIELEGLENLERGTSYIFISNHASLIDIPAVVVALPYQLRFLAKTELFKIPIFGQAVKAAGHIRIDRGNLDSAVDSIRRSSSKLRKYGSSALVFAEGTRSLNGSIGKFKKGGIILAISLGAPIAPVSISGSRDLAPKKSLRIRSGKVILNIGSPITTEGFEISDRNRLVEETRNAVIENMNEKV